MAAKETFALKGGLSLVDDPINLKGLKPEYHDALVIGGGISGVGITCNLKRKLNVTDVVVVEKLAGPAGTWEANTYPGCACDIPAPMYSFSFRQKKDWSGLFPQQPELREYVREVVEDFGIGHNFRFRSVGRQARFDDATGLWHVIVEQLREDGSEDPNKGDYTYYVCRMLFMAVGALSEPNPCTIPGKESFQGPIFHSARWDHSVDVKDKNVVVVGNGCSATQFVPIVAEQAKFLTQFVRSKHWYAPPIKNPIRGRGWEYLVRHFSVFMHINRFLFWLFLEIGFAMTFMNPVGEFMRNRWEMMCRNYVRKMAPKKYWDLLLPDSKKELMVGCRRRIIDEKYLPSLSRDNLELEPSKLTKIEKDAVVCADGRRIPADVIIMANGFNILSAGFPLKMRGRDLTLNEHYLKYGAGGLVAYRSTFVADFPNMIQLVGPNSGTGHMSVIYTSERQQEMAVIMAEEILRSPRPSQECIEHLPGKPSNTALQRGPTVEVKLDAELDEQLWIQKRMENLVFTQCDSWYRDSASGRVTAVHPDWQWRYALRTWFPVWRDFTYKNLPSGKSLPSRSLLQRIGGALGLGESPKVDASEIKFTDMRKPVG